MSFNLKILKDILRWGILNPKVYALSHLKFLVFDKKNYKTCKKAGECGPHTGEELPTEASPEQAQTLGSLDKDFKLCHYYVQRTKENHSLRTELWEQCLTKWWISIKTRNIIQRNQIETLELKDIITEKIFTTGAQQQIWIGRRTILKITSRRWSSSQTRRKEEWTQMNRPSETCRISPSVQR